MSADFRELFDSLGPALLRYLRRLTGSRSDAEELVQECFLKLHVQMEARTDLENVRAWLFRVGTNAARDLERERQVRRRETSPPGTGKIVDFETRVERQQLTRRALRRLPPRMRQVLLLWSEGFTYCEMAKITGIEPGYVGVLLQRARAGFRKEYEEEAAGRREGRARDGLF